MLVEIPRRLLGEIGEQTARAHPLECCGAMLGSVAADRVRVERLVSLANVAADPERRFEIDTLALLGLQRAGRGGGDEVVGYYHSHPVGEAVPSETDRAAAWPGLSYLIAARPGEGSLSTRSWRLEGESFVEERLVVTEPGGDAEPRRDEGST